MEAKKIKRRGVILWGLLLVFFGLLATMFVGGKKEQPPAAPFVSGVSDRQVIMQTPESPVKSPTKNLRKRKPGPTLFVQSKTAKLYETPSTRSKILMELRKGHKVTELERIDHWVKVRVETAKGTSGWIHRSEVGAEFIGGSTYSPKSAAFGRFLREFDDFNTQLKISQKTVFFTEAEDLGDGVIQVTATQRWLNSPKEIREKYLNTIFQLWNAADRSGLPITVHIADHDGSRRLSKWRKAETEQNPSPANIED